MSRLSSSCMGLEVLGQVLGLIQQGSLTNLWGLSWACLVLRTASTQALAACWPLPFEGSWLPTCRAKGPFPLACVSAARQAPATGTPTLLRLRGYLHESSLTLLGSQVPSRGLLEGLRCNPVWKGPSLLVHCAPVPAHPLSNLSRRPRLSLLQTPPLLPFTTTCRPPGP